MGKLSKAEMVKLAVELKDGELDEKMRSLIDLLYRYYIFGFDDGVRHSKTTQAIQH